MKHRPAEFHEALRDELHQIDRRRTGATVSANTTANDAEEQGQSAEVKRAEDLTNERAVQTAALNRDVVGLAISGGGIRSATFALGLLQALGALRLLHHFDYISTVSGGGYIGGWLAAWIKRQGNVRDVEMQLDPNHVSQAQGRSDSTNVADEEPEPIYHLRAYSNYLAPRPGLLSADFWVLIAIYLRNVFVNQLVLMPICLATLLLPRLMESGYGTVNAGVVYPILESVMFISLVVAFVFIFRRTHIAHHPKERAKKTNAMPIQARVLYFRIFMVLPLVIFAVIASWDLGWIDAPAEAAICTVATEAPEQQAPEKPESLMRSFAQPGTRQFPKQVIQGWNAEEGWWENLDRLLPWQSAIDSAAKNILPDEWPHRISMGFLFASVFGVCIGLLNILSRARHMTRLCRAWQFRALLPHVRLVLSSSVAAALGGALLYAVFGIALQPVYDKCWDVAFMAAFGPPLVMVAIVATISLGVGFAGTLLSEDDREWWASLSGWLLICAAGWGVVVGISSFGPFLVVNACKQIPHVAGVLGTGWIGTIIAGLFAGKGSKTGYGNTNRILELLARAAPPLFLVALLTGLALLIDLVQGSFPSAGALEYFEARQNLCNARVVLGAIIACIVLAGLADWCIDVNAFSLSGMYANRLVRCYLGASRRKAMENIDRWPSGKPTGVDGPVRQPDPVTGFDPTDDIPLHKLRVGERSCESDDKPYQGPLLVVNTAMNLVEGDELAWQERKAESFSLTPSHCGSRSTGYCRLPQSGPYPLQLGTTMAISGAAVSPNMGFHSSAAVTALLAVFDARLGAWMANPRHSLPNEQGPRFGLYLVKELFGRTNAQASYVYLSDGGHFDNLGVYELVRRRCRYIVVCDGEQDESYQFPSLSRVIRECFVDFGIRIVINVDDIRPRKAGKPSLRHCAIGTIHYEDIHNGAEPGVLIYLKASLTGDEPAEVRNYAEEHRPFPHQTTANQFFTESQFESYRALGYHVARHTLCKSVQAASKVHEVGPVSRDKLPKLFKDLRSRWGPKDPERKE